MCLSVVRSTGVKLWYVAESVPHQRDAYSVTQQHTAHPMILCGVLSPCGILDEEELLLRCCRDERIPVPASVVSFQYHGVQACSKWYVPPHM